ncbi:hypothetical protein [Mucilaginibacter flavidus]|uniref:hypothetical protein n=1 Tax=Mucilaginibacter flavidus TaxID=2949309 RepID=UPI002093BEA4|nr:hypothetical protein [Mucilaginibacter flavidus]MCO5947986.1 hypothetical protein [Mucilaginibacter flavidus]
MRIKITIPELIVLILLGLNLSAKNKEPEGLILQTVDKGLMQYYVSLPAHWSPAKRWPVIVIAGAADKKFKENTLRFIKVRGQKPFIIVSPVIVTNGNYGRRNPAVYPYSPGTWDKIDEMTDCKFDTDGVIAAVREVKKKYNGDDHFFITGFEAGAHLVWAMVFQHPEMLRAAVPVAGNYTGRCLDNGAFSSDPSKTTLAVKGLVGGLDKVWGPGGAAHVQWENAKRLASEHGYKNVSEMVIPGKGHVPLPDAIFLYFSALGANKE